MYLFTVSISTSLVPNPFSVAAAALQGESDGYHSKGTEIEATFSMQLTNLHSKCLSYAFLYEVEHNRSMDYLLTGLIITV